MCEPEHLLDKCKNINDFAENIIIMHYDQN